MAEAQTVYVDDSGTDGKSKVAAAAFCVSTAERWQELLDRWNKIADHAGFELRNFQLSLQLADESIRVSSVKLGARPYKTIRGRDGLKRSEKMCLTAWRRHW
jgi:hypothetical protein